MSVDEGVMICAVDRGQNDRGGVSKMGGWQNKKNGNSTGMPPA